MGVSVRGITTASLLAASICVLAPGAALAVPDTDNAFDITIVSSGTTTVPFNSGTYLANADDEVITVSDLQAALHSGPVTISGNTGGGDEEGGLNFDAPVTTPAENSNALTLEPGPSANGAGVQFVTDDGPSLGGNLVIDGGGESFAPIAGAGGL